MRTWLPSCILVLFKKKKSPQAWQKRPPAGTSHLQMCVCVRVCMCVCGFGTVQMSCCSRVKEGRETRVEENERSLSGRVLAAVGSHYPPFIKAMASPRHMFRLGEPALTLKNLFAFCFVNRLLLSSWEAADAICSPSPKAAVITEGGAVAQTPGFCVHEGLGARRTFSSFCFWNPRSVPSDTRLLMGKIVVISRPLQC